MRKKKFPEPYVETDVVVWSLDKKILREQLMPMMKSSVRKEVITRVSEDGESSGQFFVIYVPENAAGLQLIAKGGSGDVDLYVKHGNLPTTSSYDCHSTDQGTQHSCSLSNPQKGTYYVMLRGNVRYWGVSVTGIYEMGGTAIPSIAISPVVGMVNFDSESPSL